MGPAGKGAPSQAFQFRSLAGDLFRIWALALWLSRYLSAEGCPRLGGHGLGRFLLGEISYYIPNWLDRWSAALAHGPHLRFADLALPDQPVQSLNVCQHSAKQKPWNLFHGFCV